MVGRIAGPGGRFDLCKVRPAVEVRIQLLDGLKVVAMAAIIDAVTVARRHCCRVAELAAVEFAACCRRVSGDKDIKEVAAGLYRLRFAREQKSSSC